MKSVNVLSMELFAAWRAQGAPFSVTAHEAWRLSGGLAGRENDHGSAVALSAVAVRTATRQRDIAKKQQQQSQQSSQ